MEIIRFDSVLVVVANLQKSRRFFEAFLMLKNTGVNMDCYCLEGDSPDIYVKEIKDAVVDLDQPGYHFRHLGFEVDKLENLIDRAVEFGFECFQMAYDGTVIPVPDSNSDLGRMPEQVIFIRDYDNNLWEFVERGRSLPMLFER